MATSLLTGIITNKGREVFAKRFGIIGTGVATNTARAFKFKYGEGGFIDTGSGRIPKSPTEGVALLDVEAAASGSLFEFEKNLIATDFTFLQPDVGTSIMQVRCRLAEIEANDNGFGDSPRFFEIGIFDDESNMLAWVTFSEQTKAASKILTNFVQVQF